MATYVVTGASRGLGFEFLRQLSLDPAATVIGFVRDAEATEKKVAKELNRSNVHIIQADLTDYESLKNAAQKTSALTNGSLDYLIANAVVAPDWSQYVTLGQLADRPEALAKDLREHFDGNVVGNIHLFNLFLPLILKGTAKKIIAISTGMADGEMIRQYDVAIGAAYSIAKAALNVAVAKYSAEYRSQGVLFLSISPGVVDTGLTNRASDEEKQKFMELGAKFHAYAPHFTGPMSPEESVKQVLSVVGKASIEDGYGGAFISHLGNKQWL
ncbi:NAD(P)-binding protein [Thozetella sp. PMI_491]|nr:NAD(P)-binding protein [Thozetella sp. PMI_491]